jgi:ElaB/YqjD/DUF883 family membrane-anchored ribosome-binding protein
MPAANGKEQGWLGGLADGADRFVQDRFDRLAATAREQSGRIAEHAAERFSRNLVEHVAQRLSAQLAWAAATIAALVIAVWLLAVGVAGALGDVLGASWRGQLVAGGITLLAALLTIALVRARTRRRAEEAKAAEGVSEAQELDSEDSEPDPDAETSRSPGQDALEAATDLLRRHPVAGMATLAAVGLLVGWRVSRSEPSSRQADFDARPRARSRA